MALRACRRQQEPDLADCLEKFDTAYEALVDLGEPTRRVHGDVDRAVGSLPTAQKPALKQALDTIRLYLEVLDGSGAVPRELPDHVVSLVESARAAILAAPGHGGDRR